MKRTIVCLMIFMMTFPLFAQKVGISGNKFTVADNEIWFNGINTPWHKFVDFGRSDFEPAWWETEFQKYAANHINLARVWIHCSGEVSPDIDANGYVSGASDLFWAHMDHLFEVSRDNKIYLMPALFSFDITKSSYPTNGRWRAFLQSADNIQSYIDNVLIPLVQRYEDEPYLLGWEICNEPEWMFENSEHGPQSFADVQRFHAMLAAAIHKNSSSFVTTGSAAPKWNSPIYDTWGDNEGNMFSDEALSAIAGDAAAYLDFYQYHWYPWQSEWMASPFTQTTVEYEVDDRPVIVGESEGNDVCDAFVCQTVSEMYESAWRNGFDGVCAWKTPQNDGHGTFENIAVATNAFYNNHPHLVYPSGSTDPEIPIDYYTLEVSTDGNGSVTVVPMNEEYPAGSSVTVSATASVGYRFSHWSGSLEGSISPLVITINEHLQLMAHFVEHTVVDPCANAQVIALPFSFDGVGEYCWVSDQTIAFVNSWNMELVEINGVDYTNKWSNTLPEPIDGKYFIHYMGNYAWSHFEAPQTKVASGSDIAKAISSAALFPNPFKDEMTLNLSHFAKVEMVTITDLSGVVVETIVPQETILQIGQNLESGTYIVLVKGAGELNSYKITKQ